MSNYVLSFLFVVVVVVVVAAAAAVVVVSSWFCFFHAFSLTFFEAASGARQLITKMAKRSQLERNPLK